MSYEHILFTLDGGVARMTLNRPDRLNSFNDAMHAEVRDALGAVRADASARVLLLTGAGRGFCAGQDLSDRAVSPGGAPVDLGASIERNYKPLVLALRSLPLPVVCAVNGVAAGAGANIALACDLVIAAQFGELHPGVLQDRARARLRRHVFPAAAGRHGAGDGAGAARRQDLRGAGGGLGAHLAVRRRCRACGDRGSDRRPVRVGAHARARARPSERCTRSLPTRSRRSSISSATSA